MREPGREIDRERERDRGRERERDRTERRRRSASASPGKIPLHENAQNIFDEHSFHCNSGRKFEKKDNEPPLRLLDDLFRKTKTTPCIYWLPLTPEQV